MYRRVFPQDMLAELDRLQRAMQESFDLSQDITPSIRGYARSGFPSLNVGSTSQSVEIYAFVPGVAPENIELQIEKGLLTIAGERKPVPFGGEGKATAHIEERFAGKFRRVVALPDDIDANAVDAKCRDGVLHVSIRRQAAAQPRRISIQ